MIKNDRLTLYVSSPDSYSDVFEVFLKAFKRYWADCPYRFLLCTNTKTYDGIDVICNHQTNDDQIRRTVEILPEFKTKYVMLLCDDLIISDYVKTADIESILNYMDAHDLTYCRMRPIQNGDILNDFPLCKKLNKTTPYGLNFQTGIFRIDYFKEVVGTGDWDAYDVENNMNDFAASSKDEYYIDKIAVSKSVLHIKHGVAKGKWLPSAANFVLNNGLADKLDRGVLPKSYEYNFMLKKYVGTRILHKHRRFVKNILSLFGIHYATRS